MLTGSKLLFCYQSKGKKTSFHPWLRTTRIFLQLCPAPPHRGPFTPYLCTPCPLMVWGSVSPWLNAGSLPLLPQTGSEFITWRHLVSTLMTIWWNTDFTSTVYSHFIFSLNYNVISLQARCSNDRDPASLQNSPIVAAAPFFGEPGTRCLKVFRLNPLPCSSLLHSPHNCFSCSRLSRAFQHIWKVGKNILSARTEESSTELSTQLKEKLGVSISPRSYKDELWSLIDLEASSLCYFFF